MEKEYLQYLWSEQWRQKVKQRLEIDGFSCQQCGSRGTETNRLEIHHFNYKNLGNEDVYTDLVTLCSNCHKSIHSTLSRITDPGGGRMWDRHQQIPKIHVFTISGIETMTHTDQTTTEKGGQCND